MGRARVYPAEALGYFHDAIAVRHGHLRLVGVSDLRAHLVDIFRLDPGNVDLLVIDHESVTEVEYQTAIVEPGAAAADFRRVIDSLAGCHGDEPIHCQLDIDAALERELPSPP